MTSYAYPQSSPGQPRRLTRRVVITGGSDSGQRRRGRRQRPRTRRPSWARPEGRHHSLAELASGLRQVRSAHCVGQNGLAVGIENEGTYTSAEPPAQQYEALVALCAHICRQYGLPPSEIHGHRDYNATQCPGDRLYALLPRLRQDVAARVGEPLWQGFEYGERDHWVGPAEYLPPDALDHESIVLSSPARVGAVHAGECGSGG